MASVLKGVLALYTVGGEPVEQAVVGQEYLLLYLQTEPADLTLHADTVEAYEGNTLVPRYLTSPNKVTLVGGWLPTGFHACDADFAFLYGWMIRFLRPGSTPLRVHHSELTIPVSEPQLAFSPAGDFAPASGSELEILNTRLVHMAAGRKRYLIDLRVPQTTAVFNPKTTLSETAILYLKSPATPSARLCVDYNGTQAVLTTTDHAGNPIITNIIWRCEVICE
jgi:hypothetical protein